MNELQKNPLTQWNLSSATPPMREDKIWSRKNVHIIFVVIAAIEETPLSRPGTKGHFCWVPKPWFNLHSLQWTP